MSLRLCATPGGTGIGGVYKLGEMNVVFKNEVSYVWVAILKSGFCLGPNFELWCIFSAATSHRKPKWDFLFQGWTNCRPTLDSKPP